MRLTIAVDGIKEVQQQLRFSDRRLAASAATALTRTAAAARDDVKQQMPSVFDRPTPYTLGGVGMKGATAQNLEAEVFIKDQQSGDRGGRPAAVYLRPQVSGGGRRLKAVERVLRALGALPAGLQVVPGAGASIDQYGNLAREQLTKIIRQLRTQRVSGPVQPRKRIAAARSAGGTFFVMPPGRKGAAPGIYARDFSGRNITPVILFARPASYRARFDFEGIVTRSVQQRLRPQLEQAIAESFGRLLARGG